MFNHIHTNYTMEKKKIMCMCYLERGCTDWQVLEILETQEWETKQGSNLERSHLHLMLHWEKNLQLQESCRFLERETNVNN